MADYALPSCDPVNEKVRVTKERLYSKQNKRGRASGVKKKVTGQLKNTEKHRGDSEQSRKQFTGLTPKSMRREEAETTITK